MLNTNNLPSVSTAKLPEVYEAAKASLAECQKIDECKDWTDKSIALASYAKQARDDELLNMAHRIKARAVRRTGELLKQVAPEVGGRPQETKEGDHLSLSCRKQAANNANISEFQQKTALRVASIPEDDFEAQVDSKKPPTVTALAEQGIKRRTPPDPQNWLKGRKPNDFNRVLHFAGLIRCYSEELVEWDLERVLPHFLDKEKADTKAALEVITEIHSAIQKRI